MDQELVQVLAIIVLQAFLHQQVAHVILRVEHIIPVDIVFVQMEVVVLIRRKQDVLALHHVRVQLVKDHPMVAIVLVVDIQGLTENVSALVA